MADLNSIFANMGQNFDQSKAGDLDLTIAFNLSGEGGGQWYAKIAGGKLDFATSGEHSWSQLAGEIERAPCTAEADAIVGLEWISQTMCSWTGPPQGRSSVIIFVGVAWRVNTSSLGQLRRMGEEPLSSSTEDEGSASSGAAASTEAGA